MTVANQKSVGNAESVHPAAKLFVIIALPAWAINAYAIKLGYWQWGVALSTVVIALLAWQHRRVESMLAKLLKLAIEYHVSPKIFVWLYALSFIPFYIGLFMMGEGATDGNWVLVGLGGIVNRAAFAMPYLYPLFCGTLPKKLKVAVWGWLAVSVAFFVVTKWVL